MRIGDLEVGRVFLAPMEEVTDRAFRRLCKRMGADVMYTEFVPAEAMVRNIAAAERKLAFGDEERPLGIQIYGNRIEGMVDAAKIDRFALYGTSQGAPIAVSYAVRHPDRVSHLVLKAAIYAARKRNANRAKPSWP